MLVLAVLVIEPASAAGPALQTEYPAGSIRTREQAAAALQSARAHAEEIERSYRAEISACAATIFVTRCENKARSKRDAEMREVERVRLEAHSLTRRLDADERARARAAEETRRAAEAPERRQREAESRAEFEARRKQAEQRPPRTPPAGAPVKPAPPSRSLTPQERAENVRRFQEKQRAAAEYAQRKAKEREESIRRREQRKKEMQAEEDRRAAAAAAQKK
ncbi:MAG: hypothetical protein ACM3PU_16490 [Gemmatimonadota bacterium]